MNKIILIPKIEIVPKIGIEIKNGIKVRKDLLYEVKKDEEHKPFVLGKNIFEFYNTYDNLFIDYKSENEKLYTNQAFRTKDIFEQEKLITRQILGKRIITCFDDTNLYSDQTTYVINKTTEGQNLKYLLCILNSKLIYYYFTNTFSDNKITFPKVKRSQLLELPYSPNLKQDSFVTLADNKIEYVLNFKTILTRFTTYLQSQFSIEKLQKKLQNWYELAFGDFIKELNKAIKKAGGEKLSKVDEMEWMELFETKKAEAQTLKAEIDQTDAAIDQMVYELYGLTEEEIQIVEAN